MNLWASWGGGRAGGGRRERDAGGRGGDAEPAAGPVAGAGGMDTHVAAVRRSPLQQRLALLLLFADALHHHRAVATLIPLQACEWRLRSSKCW